MNISFYIAKRYLLSKSSNNAINIITILATIGVVLATAALFVVLAGFSGLKQFSLGFYNTADPDLKVIPATGKTFLFNDRLKHILATNDIADYSKVLEERAFFQYQGKEYIAYLYGVDDRFLNVTKMDTMLTEGRWLTPELPYGVVTGLTIANKLNLRVDYLTPMDVYVPKPGNNYNYTLPKDLVNSTEVKNIGVFAMFDEWDGKYIYAYLPIVQDLLNYPLERISGVNIKLNEPKQADAVAEKLQQELGNSFRVFTREQLNAVVYRMLKTENLVSYLIFTLVLIIALFNIVGTIIMVILDKKHNMKTLLSMGIQWRELQNIFIYQGFLLSLIGMIVGIVLGLFLVYIQKTYALFMITDYMPYPVILNWQNTIIVIVTMLVLGFLASYVAGKRINKTLVQ